jgi:hypothetical protein
MFIKRKEYAESINKIHDEIRKLNSKIGKLEFRAENPPKYSIGQTFGNWKINNIFIEGDCQRNIFYWMEGAPYLLKYTCINCKDNEIKGFTEKELSELK